MIGHNQCHAHSLDVINKDLCVIILGVIFQDYRDSIYRLFSFLGAQDIFLKLV